MLTMIYDDHGFEICEENEFPLAYLLTFRTFGTWPPGDERLSVGRNGGNLYGSPKHAPNAGLRKAMAEEMRQPAVILDERQRITVESAVKEVCECRGYFLHAVNARTNHVHSVVTAPMKPERVIDALKVYSTRKLRGEGLVSTDLRIWSRGRSRRYLWKPKNVEAAIDYTLYSQGDVPFEIED